LQKDLPLGKKGYSFSNLIPNYPYARVLSIITIEYFYGVITGIFMV